MSPVKGVRLNESGWTSQLNESGWMSSVEWVRLNVSGWMSPVEWVRRWSHRLRTPSADHLSADRSVRKTHWLWVTPSAHRTDCGSPLMITLLILSLMITSADPSVDDHATADRSVRQTYWLWVTPSAYRIDRGSPLMITILIMTRMIILADPFVDDHTTADRCVRQTHWLWITPSGYRTDRGSPLMITLCRWWSHPLILYIFIFLISLLCRITWHRLRLRPGY